MNKSLIYGLNVSDSSFDYVFDFDAKMGYMPALGHNGKVMRFGLTVESIAQAAFTYEYVNSDNEDELIENAQIMSISDLWVEALNSVTDDESDLTDIKAHIGMVFLLLDIIPIPPFSTSAVQKVVKEFKAGKITATDAYQTITDGMGKDIVSVS